jgi:hypothetical protein
MDQFIKTTDTIPKLVDYSKFNGNNKFVPKKVIPIDTTAGILVKKINWNFNIFNINIIILVLFIAFFTFFLFNCKTLFKPIEDPAVEGIYYSIFN